MAKFNKEFKINAVKYYHEHRELGLVGCATNLGIAPQTLSRWQKQLKDNGEMPYRGSIRRTGAFANRGYRQVFVKNFTIVYRIDEAKKMVVIVTVRYTPSSF